MAIVTHCHVGCMVLLRSEAKVEKTSSCIKNIEQRGLIKGYNVMSILSFTILTYTVALVIIFTTSEEPCLAVSLHPEQHP